MARRSNTPLDERDLRQWKLLSAFLERLEPLVQQRKVHESFSDPRRRFELTQYLGLFLFGLFNPILTSMRALCQASQLPKVQEQVCSRPVSLGSFSEVQHLLEPELLEELLASLAEEIERKQISFSEPKLQWLVQDSTLWRALPRMHWAIWRSQHQEERAVRLHLSFHLLSGTPARAVVSEGKLCERKAWRSKWMPGDAYIGDRYYGESYQCLRQLMELQCAFVLRLREPLVMEVVEELPVSPADQNAGVTRQAIVKLGCRPCYQTVVRVVWVATAKETLLLATNFTAVELSAELVSQLYRKRWQIELFFRWIKCTVGCRHFFAQSQRGAAIQIYLVLIGCVLLQLHLGRRPNKRMMEALSFYLSGWATLEDMERLLQKELARLEAKEKR